MVSTISWLDFSDSDRCIMIEVISLFKQRDTRSVIRQPRKEELLHFLEEHLSPEAIEEILA